MVPRGLWLYDSLYSEHLVPNYPGVHVVIPRVSLPRKRLVISTFSMGPITYVLNIMEPRALMARVLCSSNKGLMIEVAIGSRGMTDKMKVRRTTTHNMLMLPPFPDSHYYGVDEYADVVIFTVPSKLCLTELSSGVTYAPSAQFVAAILDIAARDPRDSYSCVQSNKSIILRPRGVGCASYVLVSHEGSVVFSGRVVEYSGLMMHLMTLLRRVLAHPLAHHLLGTFTMVTNDTVWVSGCS